jgi:hypothetical protein
METLKYASLETQRSLSGKEVLYIFYKRNMTYKTLLQVSIDSHLMLYDFNIYRDAMRSGCSEDDLLALVGAAVRRKKQQHAGNP